jgi:Dimerisation domain
VTPELIMKLGTSFMATRHLIAAADVGAFEALGDDVLGLEALAAKIAIPRRTARICADAMVALGLLERDGDLYRNSPVADAFLSGRGPGDLRPFLCYLDVSYRAWAEFTDAIRAGQGSGFITRLDPEAQRLFSAGVESATAGSAIALAENYQFGQHRRLLDLGGGTGSFLARILPLRELSLAAGFPFERLDQLRVFVDFLPCLGPPVEEHRPLGELFYRHPAPARSGPGCRPPLVGSTAG